jgi:hypothetical protein
VSTTDPYRRCGLSDNPFAHRDHDLFDWVDRGLPEPAPPGQCRLVQVIGVSGAGKTTTLRRWAALRPGPWHYVPQGLGRLRPLPVRPLVYWDEADRAPAVLRRRAFAIAASRRATVIAGSHADLATEARAAGLSVTTVLLAPISPAELTTWSALRFAAVGSGPQWTIPESVATEVAAQAGASWWTAGDLLHIWVAEEVARRIKAVEPG